MAVPCAILHATVHWVLPSIRCIPGLLALQIVYCARAKASTLGDAKVVEEQGPARLAQELQVGHLHLFLVHALQLRWVSWCLGGYLRCQGSMRSSRHARS